MEDQDESPTSPELFVHDERSSVHRRFPKTYFANKPVKLGDELEVTISEVSKRGDGVTRIDGYVVFVPNTNQGDKLRIRITQIKPGFAIGDRVQ